MQTQAPVTVVCSYVHHLGNILLRYMYLYG